MVSEPAFRQQRCCARCDHTVLNRLHSARSHFELTSCFPRALVGRLNSQQEDTPWVCAACAYPGGLAAAAAAGVPSATHSRPVVELQIAAHEAALALLERDPEATLAQVEERRQQVDAWRQRLAGAVAVAVPQPPAVLHEEAAAAAAAGGLAEPLAAAEQPAVAPAVGDAAAAAAEAAAAQQQLPQQQQRRGCREQDDVQRLHERREQQEQLRSAQRQGAAAAAAAAAGAATAAAAAAAGTT